MFSLFYNASTKKYITNSKELKAVEKIVMERYVQYGPNIFSELYQAVC
jgi:hypothetical protein